MPTTRVNTPDGGVITVNHPEGASQRQILEFAQRELSKRQALQPTEQPVTERRVPTRAPEPRESLSRTLFDQSLQGATFGFADEVTDALGAAIAAPFVDQSFGDLRKEARQLTRERQARQLSQRPGASILANLAGSAVTSGVGAGTRAGQALVSQLGTGTKAAKAAKATALGATTGAAFGAGQADDGERLSGAATGGAFGAVLGAATPAVSNFLKSSVAPNISKEAKRLIQAAKRFDIPLSLDQVAPTKLRNTAQKISQALPFSGVDDFVDKQRTAFTRAVARTIGLDDVDNLAPESVNIFAKNNSGMFDRATQGKTFNFKQGDFAKISGIADDADALLTGDVAKIVKKNVQNFLQDTGPGGAISGDKLSSLRSSILKNITRMDAKARPLVGEIVDAIDDVASRGVSKEDAAMLKQARRHYRNFKTVEPLLEESTDGIINPTKLLARVKANKFINASKIKTGQDDLVDLARIGKRFLPIKGGSDTFERQAAAGLIVGGTFSPLIAGKAALGLGANRALQGLNRSQTLVNLAAGQKIPAGLSRLATGISQSSRLFPGQAGAATGELLLGGE